jgi:DNA-binding Lrp family transcriptional regulator
LYRIDTSNFGELNKTNVNLTESNKDKYPNYVQNLAKFRYSEQVNYDRYYISNNPKLIVAQAYVLINCELGTEESVISKLKSIEGVKEVHGIFGAYDILAKIESDRVEDLRATITWKIRKIDNIKSTLTLMGIEGQM